EAEREDQQKDASVLEGTAAGEIEEAPLVIPERAQVARSEDERGGRDQRGRDVDGRVEERPGEAEAELAEDRDHAEAHGRRERTDEIARPKADVSPARREQDGPEDHDERAGENRHRDPLAQQEDGEHGGDERSQVEDRRGDGGPDLLDRRDPEETARRGADDARGDE